MFCTKCGKELSKDSKFCPNCGLATNKNIDVGLKIKENLLKFRLTNVSLTIIVVSIIAILATRYVPYHRLTTTDQNYDLSLFDKFQNYYGSTAKKVWEERWIVETDKGKVEIREKIGDIIIGCFIIIIFVAIIGKYKYCIDMAIVCLAVNLCASILFFTIPKLSYQQYSGIPWIGCGICFIICAFIIIYLNIKKEKNKKVKE